MKNIHPNLSPINLPFFTLFDYIIIIFLVLLVLFFILKLYLKNNKKETVKITTKPKKKFKPKPFILSQEITNLEKLIINENWKSFVIESTKTLKKILEDKFKKPFYFATGKELKEILKESLTASELEKINRFFSIVDPIKFAKAKGKESLAKEIIKILTNLK